MKKQNEQYKSLHEKLGQYEFQLPESSWQDMEAILDGRKPVPKPTKPPLRWWAPGGKWGLSTLFMFGVTVGVMAVSIFTWQQMDINTPEMPLSSFTIPLDEDKITDNQMNEETEASMLSQNRVAKQETASDDQADGSIPGKQSQNGMENRQASSNHLAKYNANTQERSSREVNEGSTYNKEDQLINKGEHSEIMGALSPEEQTNADSKVTVENDNLENIPAITDAEDSEMPPALPGKNLLAEDKQPAEIDAMEQISVLEPDLLTAPKITELEQEIDPLKPKNRFDLGIKWGGDFRPGINSHVFGLHFAYKINEDWSVETGVQYKERSFVGQNNLVATVTDTVYWPNMVETFYRKDSIRHLHFVEVPLVAHYHLRPRFSLFAGGQLTFTGNNAWDETNYKQDEYGNGGIGSFSSGGYHSPGIVKISAGMILGGQYRFSRNFGIDLRYVQGITDLTYDEYYGNTENYLNTSLQLTLKWYW